MSEKVAQLVITLRYSNNVEQIIQYCKENGINNFRINLGRSNDNKNKKLFELINDACENPVLFLDIPGTKQRINKFEDAAYTIQSGSLLKIVAEDGDGDLFLREYAELAKDTYQGDILVFGDDDAQAEVVDVDTNYMIIKILTGEKIKSHSGLVNTTHYKPNEIINAKEKYLIEQFDNYNVIWGISFADTVERVTECRNTIKKGKIIAKIESKVGVNNLTSIAKEVDGIMLARGDLSIFYDNETINNAIFHKVIRSTYANKIKCILATNYFQSFALYGTENTNDSIILHNAMKAADYIVSNETSYSSYWKEIIDYYKQMG